MNYEDMDEILFSEPDKIKKVISGEEIINDEVEIEDALLEINRLEREIAFFKKLKSRRVEPLDLRMKKSNENIDILKNAILSCMEEKKTTKLEFPDVAKLSHRKKSGSWEIKDQEALDKHLESLDLISDVASQEWKYDKRKLTKLLNELNDNNNVPADAAEKSEDGVSLVVSFQDSVDAISKAAEVKRDSERWEKLSNTTGPAKPISKKEYDSLNI